MEGSGSSVKTIKGKVVVDGETLPTEADLVIVSSADRVKIGAVSFNRYELLEAMGVTHADIETMRGGWEEDSYQRDVQRAREQGYDWS